MFRQYLNKLTQAIQQRGLLDVFLNSFYLGLAYVHSVVNVSLLRARGYMINQSSLILGKAFVSQSYREHITSSGRIVLCDGTRIMALDEGKIHFGNDVRIGEQTYIYAQQQISIGDHVLIGPRCYIIDCDYDLTDTNKCIHNAGKNSSPISIGSNVWLGAHVVILRGVTIGDGCVIGAGAIVTKDIPPYSIAVGNPARVVRTRGKV